MKRFELFREARNTAAAQRRAAPYLALSSWEDVRDLVELTV